MTVTAAQSSDTEALARIEELVARVRNSRSVPEIHALGRELVREVTAYMQART
jgi:hypothetical protein